MSRGTALIDEAGTAANCLLFVFTFINVMMFVTNIIPARILSGLSTDGLVLWKLSMIYLKSYFH